MDNTASPYYPTPGETINPNAVFTLLPTGKTASETTFLFVHAHPDDESSSTGATMGALAAAGAKVHLITMTRGEMGEVIDPSLKHLEATHPSNSDHGQALGQLRTAELKEALAALGRIHHTYLGQGPTNIPGQPNYYRDSGMTWAPDGRATANPQAAADALTKQPLDQQARAIANAIRTIQPDVIITYDADGGYGHPDHKRTHEATYTAVQALLDTPYAPTAFWGLEAEYNPQDLRQQAAIHGNLDRKREAMRAHATQITITSPTTFEYSNKVPQTINATETYRLIWGTANTDLNEENTEAPGPVNSAISAIALGAFAAFAGTMYHTNIWYPTPTTWVPWGLVLALLTVYLATTWISIHTEKNWPAALTGFTAFTVISAFAYAKGSSLLVYINPINPTGTAGTIWALGTLAAATLGIITATRYRHKNTTTPVQSTTKNKPNPSTPLN